MAKRDTVVTFTMDYDNQQLTATFGDGSAPLTLNLGQFPANVVRCAALRGIKEKLSDNAAIPRDETTGRSATPAERIAAVHEMAQQLLSGTYNRVRSGPTGPRVKPMSPVLLLALGDLYPSATADVLRSWWNSKNQDEQDKILLSGPVQQAMKRHQPVAADDDLFAGLGPMALPAAPAVEPVPEPVADPAPAPATARKPRKSA